MHRLSAMDSPEPPITHHWFDSTHIVFGVLTAGYVRDTWKIELSQLTGREPDEDRYDFDAPQFDSTSVRLSWNPTSTGRCRPPTLRWNVQNSLIPRGTKTAGRSTRLTPPRSAKTAGGRPPSPTVRRTQLTRSASQASRSRPHITRTATGRSSPAPNRSTAMISRPRRKALPKLQMARCAIFISARNSRSG